MSTNTKHGEDKFTSVPQNLTQTSQKVQEKKTTGLHVTHNNLLRYA